MASSSVILSNMRDSLQKALQAYNAKDYDVLRSLRTEDYIHQLLPSSLGSPPLNNEAYKHMFGFLQTAFTKFDMQFLSTMHDPEQRKATVHGRLDLDGVAGPGSTEFVLMISFDQNGANMVKTDEFIDTEFNKTYFRLVEEALASGKGQ